MPEELLTVAEVAKLLRLNPQTIYNWIDRGELPALKMGQRRVRVRRSDLAHVLGEEDASSAPESVGLEVDPVVIEALRTLGRAALNLAAVLERGNREAGPTKGAE